MKKIEKKTSNKIINIKSVDSKDNIAIMNDSGYFMERFYFDNLFDGKQLKKFIKKVEKSIRTSSEYAKYIGALSSEYGVTNCAVLGHISKNNATVEFHHYPFTLYDIVYLEVCKRLLNKEKINTFIIASNVLKLHFDNQIGLVPLCKTVHELVHPPAVIFVNLKQVFGDLQKFINNYYSVLTDDMIENYNKLVEFSNKDIAYSENDILRLKKEKINEI